MREWYFHNWCIDFFFFLWWGVWKRKWLFRDNKWLGNPVGSAIFCYLKNFMSFYVLSPEKCFWVKQHSCVIHFSSSEYILRKM